MQIAILHHHLNRGGVTSVVANHLRSLATLPEGECPDRVVIFYDGQQDGWPTDLPDAFPIELVVEPALAYDTPNAKAAPDALASTLQTGLAAAGMKVGDTVLHVHNHALGKNASLPGALKQLAAAGWPMLLQVHDFAEDNRTANYGRLREAIGVEDPDKLGAVLYPQRPGIHYATLTERDDAILHAAGVPDARRHVLPNPVAEFDGLPSQEEARSRVIPRLGLPPEARLVVYPVRGIRRKNLGEMVLLSALAPAGTYFAVTLRPKNPIEAVSFDRWLRLAESLDLPCRFDTGGPQEEGGYGCDFKDTLAAADAILTTSVAEGFGMVFLEAWLAGKPLVGRDLPEITREFKAAGMTFRSLWTELRAPANLDADFARLTPAEQVEAIRLTKRPATPIDLGVDAAVADIQTNAVVVRERYAAKPLGERLAAVYRETAAGTEEAPTELHAGRIAEHFAAPDRQFPVRVESVASAERDLLGGVIGRLSRELPPEPTGETPDLPRLAGVRAVVFDVYGTLLVSGSGDISLASEGSRGAAALEALQAVFGEPGASATGVELGARCPPVADALGSPVPPGLPERGDEIVERLHAAIHTAHAASASDHPEVEIRDLWRSVLESLGVDATDSQVERFAVEYECRVNPIGPMPGLAETLEGLGKRRKTLGIVSNAQFFTPLAFEPLSGKALANWGFEPSLCVWSFEHGEAKPGTFLYERCADALAACGIEPQQALFVGNDLRNDVWPAQQAGFRAALFAGDGRSLRWRRDDARLAEVRPDAVITDLRQLLEIVL